MPLPPHGAELPVPYRTEEPGACRDRTIIQSLEQESRIGTGTQALKPLPVRHRPPSRSSPQPRGHRRADGAGGPRACSPLTHTRWPVTLKPPMWRHGAKVRKPHHPRLHRIPPLWRGHTQPAGPFPAPALTCRLPTTSGAHHSRWERCARMHVTVSSPWGGSQPRGMRVPALLGQPPGSFSRMSPQSRASRQEEKVADGWEPSPKDTELACAGVLARLARDTSPAEGLLARVPNRLRLVPNARPLPTVPQAALGSHIFQSLCFPTERSSPASQHL